jgi:hypothetical protein
MSKAIKHTDLAGEEPGPRADVDLPLEGIDFEARITPWLSFKLRTRTFEKSTLNATVTVALLVLTGCACTGVAGAVSAPTWLAIMMMFVPSTFYFLAARR